jgi:NAD(P)H-quinone oxidoreductase subunit 5
MPATTTAFLVGGGGLVVLFPLGTFWTMQRWLDGTWEIPWWLLTVLCLVNALSAINLTRVFRLVFLDKPQMKTRRTPEVLWPMALAMVILTVITLLTPVLPQSWSLWLSPTAPKIIDGEGFILRWGMLILIASGLTGFIVGSRIKLNRASARSIQLWRRVVQDLCAYDFYIAEVYNVTVVLAVSSLAKITNWLDRYVIDGVVNLLSLATIFSGSALRYNMSGQSQFYLLTIFLGVVLFLWFIITGQWSMMLSYWTF